MFQRWNTQQQIATNCNRSHDFAMSYILDSLRGIWEELNDNPGCLPFLIVACFVACVLVYGCTH